MAGFQEFASWIEEQNRMGDTYEEAHLLSSTIHRAPSGVSANEAVEIITHLPLALIALPFYGIYKLTGGLDPKDYRAQAQQVQLGVTTKVELMNLVGQPDGLNVSEGVETWNYLSAELQFGLVDIVVYWVETLYWSTPANDATVMREVACVPIT